MATGGFSTRDASVAAFGSCTHIVIGVGGDSDDWDVTFGLAASDGRPRFVAWRTAKPYTEP